MQIAVTSINRNNREKRSPKEEGAVTHHFVCITRKLGEKVAVLFNVRQVLVDDNNGVLLLASKFGRNFDTHKSNHEKVEVILDSKSYL